MKKISVSALDLEIEGTVSIGRFSEYDACAGGCGRARLAGSLYCAECRQAEQAKSPYSRRDLDIHIEVMEERLQGRTKWEERIEEKGTHPCGLCGRPALPDRFYCSPRCRGAAPRVGGATFVLDGVKASFLEHARRLGVDEDTACVRIHRGLDPIEALRKPVRQRPLLGMCGQVFVVDGIEATFLEHARRREVKFRTALMRISRGMDPIEALKTPVKKKSRKKNTVALD